MVHFDDPIRMTIADKFRSLRKCLRNPSLRRKVALDEATIRLQASTKLIVDRYFELQIRQKILNPMIFDKDLAAVIGESYAAHAWNFLVQSLYFDQIRGICAVVWDSDERTYSVRNALCLLSRSDVVEQLRQQSLSSYPNEPQFQTKIGEKFDIRLLEVKERWQKFSRLGYRKPFLQVRNKAIAHHELVKGEDKLDMLDLGKQGLKWGDTDKCLTAVAPIVFGLDNICRGHSYAEEQFEEIHEKWAADLWDRLAKK